MRFTFGKVTSDQTGASSGWGVLPEYNISDWFLARHDDGALVFRPSALTIGKRLVLAALLLGCAAWVNYQRTGTLYRVSETRERSAQGLAEMEELRRDLEESVKELGLSEEQIDAINAETAARQARRRETRDDQFSLYNGSLLALSGALAALGLLPVLVCLWNRVTLRIEPDGTFAISTWVPRPKTTRLRREEFAGILFGCEETTHRGRYGVTDYYWQWFVRLMPREDRTNAVAPPVTFFPLRYDRRPLDQPKPPGKVREIVQLLYSWSKLPVRGPLIADETRRDGLLGSRVTREGSVSKPRNATTKTVSMDEMPEELAGLLRGGLTFRERKAGGGQTIEVVDRQQSVVMSFHSESEMPEEIRMAYQQMQQVFGRPG